jgi:hypothetical protein
MVLPMNDGIHGLPPEYPKADKALEPILSNQYSPTDPLASLLFARCLTSLTPGHQHAGRVGTAFVD